MSDLRCNSRNGQRSSILCGMNQGARIAVVCAACLAGCACQPADPYADLTGDFRRSGATDAEYRFSRDKEKWTVTWNYEHRGLDKPQFEYHQIPDWEIAQIFHMDVGKAKVVGITGQVVGDMSSHPRSFYHVLETTNVEGKDHAPGIYVYCEEGFLNLEKL